MVVRDGRSGLGVDGVHGRHVAFKEAAEAGCSILEYAPGSAPAAMYQRLAREVMRAAGERVELEVKRETPIVGWLRGLTGRTLAGAAAAHSA